MIRLFLMLFVGCLCINGYAQQIPPPQGCGYDHYVYALDQAFPGFKASADKLFKRNTSNTLEKDQEIYKIPVVVHIVWGEEDENLPDSLVNQVMDVLNEDFRRLNADASLIRTEFADIVGDPGIEFKLVDVVRVQTEATFQLDLLGGGVPDNVKVGAEGGSDAWDTEKFMNIWVCNIQGGSVLGYAYPPADLDHWPAGANAPSPELDGIVIHYDVFRRTGTYSASGLLGGGEMTIPVRGRTITHEVGHYLGLRHIWGDGLLSILGLPDCDADDGVTDTPNQGVSSQFQCDPSQNTCTDNEGEDMPDMYENFMDYAAEDCLNSFTNQQIAIMRSVLENERGGLIGRVVSDITSIETSADFKVYPNPVDHQFFVEPNETIREDFQVRLINIQGQPVTTFITGQRSNRLTIDVSNLASGLYNLMVLQGDRQYVQRVVVQ